jgi:Tfp pilus assembly PilM family ATPase
VLREIGKPARVGLLIPDPVVKVSLLQFDRLPERRDELDQLIRWQMRKAAPFPIDDAQLGWAPAASANGSHSVVVTMARRESIEEFESVCSANGARAGIVDISTFNLINAVLAGQQPPSADWLLVNVSDDYTSIAVLRGPHLRFFRTRPGDEDVSVGDLVHQTAMYYEDRLEGRGLERLVFSLESRSADRTTIAAELRRSLERRIQAPIEGLDEQTIDGVADPTHSRAVLPLLGLLVRERVAA